MDSTPPIFHRSFGDDLGSRHLFGSVTVSIPSGRTIGDQNRGTWLRAPQWHFYTFSHSSIEEDDFIPSLRSAGATGSSLTSVLAYVHGIRNNFEDAAETLAQIFSDTGFEGVPLFISWPSHSPSFFWESDYSRTVRMGHASRYLVTSVVEDMITEEDFVVNVVAHSFGVEVVSDALVDIPKEKLESVRLPAIVLAAGDISSERFGLTIAPTLRNKARIIVAYCSERDKALEQSKRINRGTRLGDCSSGSHSFDGVESIIVRGRLESKDWFQHSYYITEYSVLADISQVINDRMTLAGRKGLEMQGNAWVLDLPFVAEQSLTDGPK